LIAAKSRVPKLAGPNPRIANGPLQGGRPPQGPHPLTPIETPPLPSAAALGALPLHFYGGPGALDLARPLPHPRSRMLWFNPKKINTLGLRLPRAKIPFEGDARRGLQVRKRVRLFVSFF